MPNNTNFVKDSESYLLILKEDAELIRYSIHKLFSPRSHTLGIIKFFVHHIPVSLFYAHE